MRKELLLQQTRTHFPRLDVAGVKIKPIEGGGSDRKFYRIHCGTDNQTLILAKYNLEREENRHYVQIAKFLDAHGIRVPKIHFHDPAEGLIWIEDLGQRDLYSYRHESWLVRRVFYESALDQIIKLHSLPEQARLQMREHLSPGFDAPLYLWEQNYFFKYCLGRCFKIDKATLAPLAASEALNEIARRLASFQRVLVHRDFQSQNIIIRNGQAYLIDFQGMRLGLVEYDLASLLYDPYVELTEAERAELTAYYRQRQLEDGIATDCDFDLKLQLCAMQRLMQALGAYGFLGLVKGHKHFLRHIPNGLRSLRRVVANVGGLRPLQELLGKLC
jgi:aminoglycoside/choline kinase family phosphotransferase